MNNSNDKHMDRILGDGKSLFNKEGWGRRFRHQHFVRREEVTNQDIVVDDSLIISLEMEVLDVERKCQILAESSPVSGTGDLIRDFSSLLHSEQLSDVKFQLDSGEEVMAHKAVLSARSPVFRAMFSVDMKEKNSTMIELPGFSKTTVNNLLHYAYTGQVRRLVRFCVCGLLLVGLFLIFSIFFYFLYQPFA
jgi:hypothetical protein